MILDYLAAISPFLLGIIIYVIRIERRLTKITTEICWIKKWIIKCQPPSEDPTV